MITVSIFGVVVIIFILHTVLTHLINWWFRESYSESEIFVIVVCVIMELLLTLSLLEYYIN